MKALSLVFLTAAAGAGPRAAPFGAGRVASAVKADKRLAGRVRVSIVEGLATDAPEALAAKAAALRPDVLGLSLYSWNAGLLGKAAAIVRASSPGLVVIAGGPVATAEPERVASGAYGCPVDATVAGEGEEALPELLSRLLAGERLGGSGAVIRAGAVDPGRLPSPWLDGTLDPGARGGAALELTRGCPYRCAFCFESKGLPGLRRFPLALAERELRRFEEAGVEEVFVLDPTFNADPKRLKEAVAAFRRAGPGLRYYIELRAELVTAEQARLLSELDCALQLGLQTADPEVSARMGRALDPAAYAKKVRLLDEEGLVYGLDLIYGLPGDSLAGFRRSLDYALGLGPNHLDAFRLAVLPGTVLADRAPELGLEHDPDAPYLVHSAPGFSPGDLAAAERLARAADLLYNRGRAVMWFRPLAQLARLRPSVMLERFADYVDAVRDDAARDDAVRDDAAALAPDAPHAAIEALQLGFVRPLLSGGRSGAAMDAALDLVRVSGAWTRALAEGERTELELGWPPEDLLDYAIGDLAAFAAEASREPARWACEPSDQGPRFRRARQGGSPKKGAPKAGSPKKGAPQDVRRKR